MGSDLCLFLALRGSPSMAGPFPQLELGTDRDRAWAVSGVSLRAHRQYPSADGDSCACDCYLADAFCVNREGTAGLSDRPCSGSAINCACSFMRAAAFDSR